MHDSAENFMSDVTRIKRTIIDWISHAYHIDESDVSTAHCATLD